MKRSAVQAGQVTLAGHLTIPEAALAEGIVVFAHGSGSNRPSPRNRYVARRLNRTGLGTLLLDLHVGAEEFDRANVFDVELLGRRLGEVTAWLRAQPEVDSLGIGYFGASTGAAAALWAAAEVGAAVSRDGRPDMAAERLAEVQAPNLLIVGSRDDAVLGLNEQARRLLRCENRLAIVPGATHLFEEEGTLDAAGLVLDWVHRPPHTCWAGRRLTPANGHQGLETR
jgi:putative phosphoribosyl transferase